MFLPHALQTVPSRIPCSLTLLGKNVLLFANAASINISKLSLLEESGLWELSETCCTSALNPAKAMVYFLSVCVKVYRIHLLLIFINSQGL